MMAIIDSLGLQKAGSSLQSFPMAATPFPIEPEEPQADRREGRLGFLEHLEELRKRIIRSCIAIGSGMLIAFFFVDRIGDFILAPTLKALPAGDALIFTKPGEGFAFYLDVSFIGGIVLAAPFVMYQVWQFIAPGLYAKEKKFAIPFVVLTTVGSIGAALFTHYVMFPGTIAFLAKFHSPAMRFMPRVEDTFELYKNMLLGMVAVFQIPTLVFFLAKMRLVTARFLWRHVKYAILISFIVAAVLTPSADPWNQTIFAAPMIALYLISIGIAWVVTPKRDEEKSSSADGTKLRLVIGAMVIDQARKNRVKNVAVR
jgi:sec-independent protein translocase protein TatC